MGHDPTKVFRSFDEDGNGTLDRWEFQQALDKLGMGLRESQVMLLMSIVDEDKSGRINLHEFCMLVNEGMREIKGEIKFEQPQKDEESPIQQNDDVFAEF